MEFTSRTVKDSSIELLLISVGLDMCAVSRVFMVKYPIFLKIRDNLSYYAKGLFLLLEALRSSALCYLVKGEKYFEIPILPRK